MKGKLLRVDVQIFDVENMSEDEKLIPVKQWGRSAVISNEQLDILSRESLIEHVGKVLRNVSYLFFTKRDEIIDSLMGAKDEK